MAYNQQKFIYYSPGDWETQDQGASRFRVWWVPTSWFTAIFLLYLPVAEGARELSGVSCTRALTPFMRAPPSWPNYFLKAHMKLPSYWRLYLHIWIWEGHKPWVDNRHLRLGNFVKLASQLTSPTKVGSRNLISLAPIIMLLFSISAYIYSLWWTLSVPKSRT